MNIIRLVCLLSFAVLWNSVVNASADEVSDEGFRLIKSAVCDPPLIHSDDPLGLRDDGDSERYSKVPAAFEIALVYYLYRASSAKHCVPPKRTAE